MNKLSDLTGILHRPILRRVLGLLFTVLFFYSGLYFTEWLFEPNTYTGGPLKWALTVVFPLLVPLSLIVNRHFGCATGSCSVATNRGHRTDKDSAGMSIQHMPGA